jgi:hypothetical protein
MAGAAQGAQQGFPESWRTLTIIDRTGAQQYKEPPPGMLHDHTTNVRTIEAFRDYEQLRRSREEWLALRVIGERETLRYARDKHPNEFPPGQDALPELMPPRAIDMRTALIPQSLNYGWLTQRGINTNGVRVWETIRKYDAALMLCMHACFQTTTTVAVRPEGTMSPALWALRVLDVVNPPDPQIEDDDDRAVDRATVRRVRRVLRQAAAPESDVGLMVLRDLFDTFASEWLTPDLRQVAWETTREWTRTIMGSGMPTLEEKAEWVIASARAGLLSNYTRGADNLTSMFPAQGTFIYDIWSTLSTEYQDLPGTQEFEEKKVAIDAVRDIVAGRYDAEENPLPHVVYDHRRRAASVFYAPVVTPLVIASACALSYLRAVAVGRILPGTEAPQIGAVRPVVAAAIPDMKAHGLHALTAHTLLRLHATLGGAVAEQTAQENAEPWRPLGAEERVGASLRETALSLRDAWKLTDHADKRKWVRAFQAGLLHMEGTSAQ